MSYASRRLTADRVSSRGAHLQASGALRGNARRTTRPVRARRAMKVSGKLQEIRHPTGAFRRLVEPLALVGHRTFIRKNSFPGAGIRPRAARRPFSRCAPSQSAKELAQFAMEGLGRTGSRERRKASGFTHVRALAPRKAGWSTSASDTFPAKRGRESPIVAGMMSSRRPTWQQSALSPPSRFAPWSEVLLSLDITGPEDCS